MIEPGNRTSDRAKNGAQVLGARQLRKSFAGAHILRGIDFSLRKGDTVLLRGDNGSGKTTLLNILTGFLEPDYGELFSSWGNAENSFQFPRNWLSRISPADPFTPERIAQEGVGRSWQENRLFHSLDLVDNLGVATPGQIGERPLTNIYNRRAVCRQEVRNREASIDALDTLGLKNRSSASAERISLGQAKRVAIARSIRAGAKVLFLDEPLSSLDSDGIRDVLNLLARMIESRTLALVIVEHDLNLRPLLPLIDRVWNLQNGVLLEETTRPARPDPRPKQILPTWFPVTKTPDAASSPRVEKLSGEARLIRVVYPGRSPGEPLLELENVTVSRGQRCIISDWSFVIRENEFLILEAPNGWGKTTLFHALAGILPLAGGKIRLAGQRVDRLPIWQRAHRGLNLLRARSSLFSSLRVNELAELQKVPLSDDYEKLGPRKIGSLSGGERQKLALSFAFDRDAMVTLLDEPLASLDAAGTNFCVSKLLAEWQAGTAILVAEPAGAETFMSQIPEDKASPPDRS